jgi:hypothetical protein
VRFGFLASYIAIWVLVFFQGLLLLALLRQLAELRRLLEQGGLQADDHLLMGTSAPEFAGLDVHSGAQVGSQNLSGSGGVILFLSPECTVCEGLADRLGQPAVNGLPPIIALCQGGRQACAGFVKRLGLEIHLVLEGAEEIAARYQVSGFPTAVVIDGKQKIRAFGHPKNVEDLTRLVARSLGVDSITADAAEKPYLASV